MLQHNARDPLAGTLEREMTLDKTTDTYLGVTRTGTRVAVRRKDFEEVLPRFEPAKRPAWWLYNFTELVVHEEGGEGEWIYEVHDSEEGIYTVGSRLTREDAYQFGAAALEKSAVLFVRLYEGELYVETLQRDRPDGHQFVAGERQMVDMLIEKE